MSSRLALLVGSLIPAALISVATAAVFFTVFVAAAMWAPHDQPAIRKNLIEAITSGEFAAQTHLGPFRTFPVYRHTFDCLLFNNLLAPESDRLTDAMSNRMVAVEPGANDPRVPPFPDCQALLRALPELGGTDAKFIRYDRYIVGMRVLGRVLLSVASVETLRHLLLGMSYLLLAAIGALALHRFVRAADAIEQARSAGYAAIAACFALFYCAHYFDATLVYAPMDWVQFVFILLSLVWPLGKMCPAALAVYAASYGSLIAIFELMTGGIPLALALLPLLLALGFRGETSAYFGKLVGLWSCFCVAVVASFAIKKAFTIVFLGDTDSFIAKLLYRTYGQFDADAGAHYSLSYLAIAYYRASALIGWGSSRFGAALVIASLAAIAFTAWRMAGSRSNLSLRRACWLSLFALAAWIAVFLNHSILHAFVMARLLVIPVMAAAVLLVTEATLRRAAENRSAPAKSA
jgi:hypothetical protein